jgi:hypothetical protein
MRDQVSHPYQTTGKITILRFITTIDSNTNIPTSLNICIRFSLVFDLLKNKFLTQMIYDLTNPEQ